VIIKKDGRLHKFNIKMGSIKTEYLCPTRGFISIEEKTFGLCEYFWCTLFSIIKLLIMIFTLSVASVGIGLPILGIMSTGLPKLIAILLSLPIGATILVLSLTGLGCIAWGIDKLCKLEEINIRLPKTSRVPELFEVTIKFIKAKKEKYCPLIEIK
jgi:hypothetical protein